MQILVAEDEVDILNLIAKQLRLEGYEVLTALDGLEAWQIFRQQSVEMALLDIMMPGMDGLTLLRKIRESSQIPVIMVTARGEEIDKVSGLAQGADDYLTKPFGMAELSARVAVQLRHLKQREDSKKKDCTSEEILTCGTLNLNLSTGILTKEGQEIELSAKEYHLLTYLMQNQEIILTKKQIYQAVWEDEYIYDDNTIMVYLSRLRNKLEDNPKEPKYLHTFRGIGYKLSCLQS